MLMVLIAISSLAAAQSASLLELHTPASNSTNTGDPDALTTLRKDVNEVNLFFTASDGRGRFVNDLTLREIDLRDKRLAPQAVHSFEVMSNRPLRCALLIDTSDSVSQKFVFEKAAAADFLAAMRPDIDEAVVIGFNNSIRLAQDWTNDSEKLRSALRGLRNGGGTAFYDALVAAAAYLQRQDENTRRIMVVITDGQDNSSHATEANAIDALLDAETAVYALNTSPPSVDSLGQQRDAQKTLSRIVGASGGRLLPGDNHRRLRSAFAKIAEEIHNQYLITYTPADFTSDGRFRKVEIKAHRHGVHVRTRQGYYSR